MESRARGTSFNFGQLPHDDPLAQGFGQLRLACSITFGRGSCRERSGSNLWKYHTNISAVCDRWRMDVIYYAPQLHAAARACAGAAVPVGRKHVFKSLGFAESKRNTDAAGG